MHSGGCLRAQPYVCKSKRGSASPVVALEHTFSSAALEENQFQAKIISTLVKAGVAPETIESVAVRGDVLLVIFADGQEAQAAALVQLASDGIDAELADESSGLAFGKIYLH